MAEHTSGAGTVTAVPPPDHKQPTEAERISTGEAGKIIGKDPRTIERWVDDRKIRGGRPRDPVTEVPIKGSHRWVDARHAVALAVGSGRAELIPQRWRYLIPLPFLPQDSPPQT